MKHNIKVIDYAIENRISVKDAALMLCNPDDSTSTGKKCKWIDQQLDSINKRISKIEEALKDAIHAKKEVHVKILRLRKNLSKYRKDNMPESDIDDMNKIIQRRSDEFAELRKKVVDIKSRLYLFEKWRKDVESARSEVRVDGPMIFDENSSMRKIYDFLLSVGCSSTDIDAIELTRDEYCIDFRPETYIRKMNESLREIQSLRITIEVIKTDPKTTNKDLSVIGQQIDSLQKMAVRYMQMQGFLPVAMIEMLTRYQRRRSFRKIPNLIDIRLSRDRIFVIARKDLKKDDKGLFDLCIAMDMDYDYCVQHVGDIIPTSMSLVDGDGNPKYNFNDDNVTKIKKILNYGQQL